jgi:pimeloyl-ACP methyl ester carboxylesterase
MQMNHRVVESNKIKMHLAEDGEGPLVVFCHGWPESWYSWRHQLKALAEAGYRVVAPDQRGYGKTDRPEAVEDYNILQLSGDSRRPRRDGGGHRRTRLGVGGRLVLCTAPTRHFPRGRSPERALYSAIVDGHSPD